MKKKPLPLTCCLISMALIAAPVYADGDMDSDSVGHTAQSLHLSGNHHVSLGAGMTIVAQNVKNVSAPAVSQGEHSGLTYSVDIALEADMGKKGGGLITLNTSQGTAVDAGATMGVNADDEAADYPKTRIAEAWYQFTVTDSANLTIGKIDPTGIYDGNEVANDETAQFLGDVFVNNAAISFPGYAAGLSVDVDPAENLDLKLGVFEMEDDFVGTLSSTFAVAEAAVATNLSGMAANVRLTTWAESADDTSGTAVNGDLSVNEDLSLFLRYGSIDEGNTALGYDSAISVGAAYQLGHGTFGAGYSSLTATTGSDETQVEIYYNCSVSDNVHITTDIQMLSNPGFDATRDDVMVYGVRTQIDI